MEYLWEAVLSHEKTFIVFTGIDDEKRHFMWRIKHELETKVKELWAFSETMNYPLYS